MEKINILLIDNTITSDTDLKDLLLKMDFNVLSLKPHSDTLPDLSNFTPHLILCRDPENRMNIRSKSELIKNMKRDRDIPVILFSPAESPLSYLDELEADLIYHIATPCSIDYLIFRINEILNGHPGNSEGGDDFLIHLKYDNRDYRLNTGKNRFTDFIISLMENSTHQNSILNNIIHHNCSIKKLDSSGEIIERQNVCQETNSSYGYRIYRAFENKEFRLYYQPILSISENRVIGFETLIRWMDPDRGVVSPIDFIPVIESSQLMVPLGYWIMSEAAEQLKKWQEKFSFTTPLRININLSPRQFAQKDLCSRMTDIIDMNGVSAENFGFEITESVLLDDVETANLTLLQFKANNFYLYMDDFGTGYSSLSYLLYFPIDIIKIDKSFVQWMHIDELSEEIVKSVINLAHNLNKKVVAEGVENMEHLEALEGMGCDYAQGYYYSQPLPGEEAEAYLENIYSTK